MSTTPLTPAQQQELRIMADVALLIVDAPEPFSDEREAQLEDCILKLQGDNTMNGLRDQAHRVLALLDEIARLRLVLSKVRAVERMHAEDDAGVTIGGTI